MAQLSDRRKRVLDFIVQFKERYGYPPTVREIGQGIGISSTSAVDYHLRALESEGYLRRRREISRGLELADSLVSGISDRLRGAIRVPVVGRIAAGQPIEAVKGHHEEVELSGRLCDEGCYALKVKGKSMIEDLIDDGDLVVIRPQETADDGEIVVALLTDGPSSEGSATLKRLYREKDRIRLQPANSAMEPIYVDPNDLRIQGKVVAVIRQL